MDTTEPMLFGCIFLFGELAVSFREALINFSGVGNLPDGRFVGKVPWKRCRPCQKARTFVLMGLTGWSVDFWKKVDDEISLIPGIYIIYTMVFCSYATDMSIYP